MKIETRINRVLEAQAKIKDLESFIKKELARDGIIWSYLLECKDNKEITERGSTTLVSKDYYKCLDWSSFSQHALQLQDMELFEHRPSSIRIRELTEIYGMNIRGIQAAKSEYILTRVKPVRYM